MKTDRIDVDRTLLAFGAAGPLLFAISLVVLGAAVPGYDHASNAISELGAKGSPVAAVMNSVFFMLGLSIAGFGAGLFRNVAKNHADKAGAVALVLSGAFTFLLGVFPCDVGCVNTTNTGLTHNAINMMPVIFGIIAMFLFYAGIKGSEIGKYSLYLLLSALLSVIFGYLYLTNSGALAGLLQRLAVFMPLAAMAAGSLILLKEHGKIIKR
ncbi:MAG: DUF998 domain-containing protein [Candidatus Aenigmarchaeota archaeon]|nr:DUF998 domain-containing protein [Candidatus Aenigmarchaeota archaeon]